MDSVLPEAALYGLIKIRMALRQVQEIMQGCLQGKSIFGVQNHEKDNNALQCGQAFANSITRHL